jgi:HD superfamily phosphodiesterase
MTLLAKLTEAMLEHEKGCPQRSGHFLKVYGYAKAIGELEGLDEQTQFILQTAALVHDIGIRPSREKFNSSAGTYQEKEGPPVARAMLARLGFAGPVIERVCWLVAHHHTYTDIEGADYQILVEADFLVNMHEEEMSAQAVQGAYRKIFTTEAGRRFCRAIYGNLLEFI